MPEEFLLKRLEERKQQNALRELRHTGNMIDFCSNDYLGIARDQRTGEAAMGNDNSNQHLKQAYRSGSTGSRLLSGNYPLIEEVEKEVALFHDAPAGLIFNSGYDANLGLLSCVPQRGDTIIYDYLSHASLRDGIRLSLAQSFSFNHNDLQHLASKLEAATGTIYVITESVFSMDGDMAPLSAIIDLCEQYNANVIVDEAHATGVLGHKGEGLVQYLGVQNRCFARIHTFGKACGAHGAIVLGSEVLRNYLVNFCRPFMYTTALPEVSVAGIRMSYSIFPGLTAERARLQALVLSFQTANIKFDVVKSSTPIQAVIIPGNDEVKRAAQRLQDNNFDVRPILYPSVPKGAERLRIVLHAYNTTEEVSGLVSLLK